MERNKGSMGRKLGLVALMAGLFSSTDFKKQPNVSAKGNFEYRNPIWYGRNQRKKKSNGIHRSRMLRMKHRKNK